MEANKENRSQKKEPENVFTVHLMHLDTVVFVFSVFFFDYFSFDSFII